MTTRTAVVLQPLPNLAWPGATGYSEFPSLGAARLSDDFSHLEVQVRAGHPRAPLDVKESLDSNPDVVIIGDFRYYAYFANPLHLISACLRDVRNAGWTGPVVIAGRHASQMASLATNGVTIAGSYRDLVTLVSGVPAEGHGLGGDDDALPGPGVPDMAVLDDGTDLPGSFSRPGSRMGQLVLSKGCPFTCAFCEKAGLPVSTMSLDQLEVALDRFAKHRIERIIFWDEVFAWPHNVHKEQIRMLGRSKMGFNCNARLDSLRPDFVDLLAEAGCKEVLFGLELIHEFEPVQSGYLGLDKGKQKGVQFISERIQSLKSHGISPVGSLIVGLPGDDERTIARRIDMADSLGLSHCYIRPLVPFPESAIYRELRSADAIADFSQWNRDELASFPHGYPTVSSLPRMLLAALCGR
ncbi:MAG TPA: hypothetical protein DEG43_15920 [Acidimicrobiaceae bacterium]|nr:hypothetical protein [Acidimicrobiaceae bacterium]